MLENFIENPNDKGHLNKILEPKLRNYKRKIVMENKLDKRNIVKIIKNVNRLKANILEKQELFHDLMIIHGKKSKTPLRSLM
jgi:hypothetical protein